MKSLFYLLLFFPVTLWGQWVQNGNKVYHQGAVGINTTDPDYRLSFGRSYGNKMIALYDGGSDAQWYGLGMGPGDLRLHIGSSSHFLSAYAGDGNRIFRVKGTGDLEVSQRIFTMNHALELFGKASSSGQGASIRILDHSFSGSDRGSVQLTANSAGSNSGGEVQFKSFNGTTTKTNVMINREGKVGIGTIYPKAQLSFGTNQNHKLIGLYDGSNGNSWYGLGIMHATMRLQIAAGSSNRFGFFSGDNNEVFSIKGSGKLMVTNAIYSGSGNLELRSTESSGSNINLFDHNASGNSNGSIVLTARMPSSSSSKGGRIAFVTNQNGNMLERMSIEKDGKVHIGDRINLTNSGVPVRLTVDGAINSREVRVTQTGWADFVFAENYDLPSLSDISSFIATYRHLPGVPSEAEILRDGNDLAATDAILLQKIEELTLYVIQLEKEVQTLKQDVRK